MFKLILHITEYTDFTTYHLPLQFHNLCTLVRLKSLNRACNYHHVMEQKKRVG